MRLGKKSKRQKTFKQSTWQKYTGWVHRHKISAFIILILSSLLGASAVTAAYLYPTPTPVKPATNQAQESVAAQPVQKWYSPLTGLQVADESATHRQVTAIMIENSPTARPQSGIKAAGVVFEAIAEGGITRFLTLHQEDRPQLIGPVRSLRPYYIDWLAPFDAAVAHVGGSLNALNTIRNGQFKDIDQFFNGNYYWRATDRYAPHNVYTSFDKLDALNTAKGYTSSNFTPWPRKIDTPLSIPPASKINIEVSSYTYNVEYIFDKNTDAYFRNIGGQAHKDREAGHIMPKVVIAIKVPTQIGFEDGYREQMTTIGSGEAYIFQDGGVTQGYWHKADQKAQMQFFDKFGRIVKINAGQTWITAIAPEKNVQWQ